MISPSHYECYERVNGLGKVVDAIPTASIFGLGPFLFTFLLTVGAGNMLLKGTFGAVVEFMRLYVDLNELVWLSSLTVGYSRFV